MITLSNGKEVQIVPKNSSQKVQLRNMLLNCYLSKYCKLSDVDLLLNCLIKAKVNSGDTLFELGDESDKI